LFEPLIDLAAGTMGHSDFQPADNGVATPEGVGQ
jgi:hypothetical protein